MKYSPNAPDSYHFLPPRVMEEEKRKTLKDQQRFNQQNEQYKDRLARKRHDDQLGKLVNKYVIR